MKDDEIRDSILADAIQTAIEAEKLIIQLRRAIHALIIINIITIATLIFF